MTKLVGNHAGGDGDDLLQITLMAEASETISEAYLDRLRPKVRELLRRHWRKLEAVADALLTHRQLQGTQIDAIIDGVTPPRERDIAERIAASVERKWWRAWYEIMQTTKATETVVVTEEMLKAAEDFVKCCNGSPPKKP